MNLTDDNYNGLTSPPIHNNPFQPEESGNATSTNSASENYEDETAQFPYILALHRPCTVRAINNDYNSMTLMNSMVKQS